MKKRIESLVKATQDKISTLIKLWKKISDLLFEIELPEERKQKQIHPDYNLFFIVRYSFIISSVIIILYSLSYYISDEFDLWGGYLDGIALLATFLSQIFLFCHEHFGMVLQEDEILMSTCYYFGAFLIGGTGLLFIYFFYVDFEYLIKFNWEKIKEINDKMLRFIEKEVNKQE